jgi:membrane dipeptidase
MIVFYVSFMNCNSNIETTIEMVVDHINYVRDRIGLDHIGIGSDFDGIEALVWSSIILTLVNNLCKPQN